MIEMSDRQMEKAERMRYRPEEEGRRAPVTTEMLQEADPEFIGALLFLLQCTPNILRLSIDFDADPLEALGLACEYAWATERADPDTIAASEETLIALRTLSRPVNRPGEEFNDIFSLVTGTVFAEVVTDRLPYGHFALLSTRTPCWVPFQARGPIEFDLEDGTYIGITAPWIQCYFTPLQKEND